MTSLIVIGFAETDNFSRWSSDINVFKVRVMLKKKRPTIVASLMLVACLVVEIIQN